MITFHPNQKHKLLKKYTATFHKHNDSHLFHYLKCQSVFQNRVVFSETFWCSTLGATIQMPHMIYIHHQYHLFHYFTYPFYAFIFQDFALLLISFYDCSSYIFSITVVVSPGQGITVTINIMTSSQSEHNDDTMSSS